MDEQSKQNNFNMDLNLNLLIPPNDIMSSNLHSSGNNNNKILLIKKEYSKTNTLFNTFSSKVNTVEIKSQKKIYNSINPKNNNNKIEKINKAKSAKYKKINYNFQEEENKDSYTYLVKLKKYYSSNNYNKSKYNCNSHTAKKIKKRINNKEINNTNNYYTINNYYINSKLSMAISTKNNKNNFKNFKIIPRNISNSYFNKRTEFKNDMSEIMDTRKKFNETYNHFYDLGKNKKEKEPKIHNNETCQYSTMNEYWNKRKNENAKKIIKIKKEMLKKGKIEIKSVPKISDKSKELAYNSNKNKNFKFNNIFDKLFQKKKLYHSHIDRNRTKSKPKINEKSEKLIRTIGDLYLWNNKRQKKIKEYENKIYKKEIFKKKNINLTSETILKERRPFYINKKVEDRLIEQGQHLKTKNNKMKEKCIKELTEQKKYINNNYNYNNRIKSRYMHKEESKNNDVNNNSNIKKNNNIFNCNYDYNINIFNKRTALFDKSKTNIIRELNRKFDKNENTANKHSKTLLLQNYMMSKINKNKNNIKIQYNVTDFDDNENKKENINEDHNQLNKIEELKLGLINNINNNYEKNEISMSKNINNKNNSEQINKEKNSNISRIKDKRMEDLKKIIDFSDMLFKS